MTLRAQKTADNADGCGRAARTLLVATALCLALAACGGDEDEGLPGTPRPTPTPTIDPVQATVDAKIRLAIASIPTATPIVFPTFPPFPTPIPTPTPIVFPTFPPTATPVPTATPQPSAAAIYGQVRAAIARISTNGAVGSGVYIGDRYVITAAHVVLDTNGLPRQGSLISVELDSQRITRRATLTGWDRNMDIAILRLESEPGTPVAAQSFRRTALDGAGEIIFAVGYPQGTTGAPVITQGVISRYVLDTTQPPPVGRVMQYDAATAQGGSGSPGFDAGGKIVSIVQTINVTSSGSGIGLARGIVSDEIMDVLEQLKAGAQR